MASVTIRGCPGLLRAGYIHVWVVRISARLRVGSLICELSHEERLTAHALANAQAKIEYVVSRQCLWAIASRYLGVGRSEMALHKTILGQPLLVHTKNWRLYKLNVSLSHCVHGVALAFGRKARVGVDFETHQHPPAVTAAVARLFAGQERSLSTTEQIWDCWTRKEALLKGFGLGLSGMATMPALGWPVNVVKFGAVKWTVKSLPSPAHSSLACASEGARRIRIFNLKSCKDINRRF